MLDWFEHNAGHRPALLFVRASGPVEPSPRSAAYLIGLVYQKTLKSDPFHSF